jgi:hypothetical protein
MLTVSATAHCEKRKPERLTFVVQWYSIHWNTSRTNEISQPRVVSQLVEAYARSLFAQAQLEETQATVNIPRLANVGAWNVMQSLLPFSLYHIVCWRLTKSFCITFLAI